MILKATQMSDARFRIVQAGPLISFQDSGRPGHMRFGVPASGPMDQSSYRSANLIVGNLEPKTAIEISMGGLELECLSGVVMLAAYGGQFDIRVDGEQIEMGHQFAIRAGQRLIARASRLGSWCYLACAGELVVPKWIGSAATHSMSGFGGGSLTTGQEFDISNVKPIDDVKTKPHLPPVFSLNGYVRVVLGPQGHHFTNTALKRFLNEEYLLTGAYDRMGMRLKGPALEIKSSSLSIPSEPVLKGSIQVAGDGIPTILLADHQTTGGYPKIATVISTDFDALVQLRPHDKIRFKAISSEDAIRIARVRAIDIR